MSSAIRRVTLSCLPALVLSACQTPGIDPQSTTIVYGEPLKVANCFVLSTSALIVGIDNGPAGTRAVTTTVYPDQPTAYRVVFTAIAGGKLQVAGYPIGTEPTQFFWFSYVRPKLKSCVDQLDAR